MKIVLSMILVPLLSVLFSGILFSHTFLTYNSSFIIEFIVFFTAGVSSAFLYKKYTLGKFVTLVIACQLLALFFYCILGAFDDYEFYFPQSDSSFIPYINNEVIKQIRNLWIGLSEYPIWGIFTFPITLLSIFVIKLRSNHLILNNKSETIKNNSLPGLLSLLEESWKLYKRNFKILTILSFVAYISGFISSNNLSPLGGISFKSSPVLYISIIIVATAISFWGFVAMLYAIKDEKNGINIREALTKGFKKLIPNLWVIFLSVFIMLGGFFLLVVPGIIFLVWFSLSSFILVTENVGSMSALLKSREYIRGYFWPVVGRLSLFWIVFLGYFYLFKLLNLPLYVDSIFSAINSMIATPFYLIYGFLLYKHLKSIKGEITLGLSPKNKVFFIICGILGVIIPIILIIVFLFFSAITSQKSPTTQINYNLENPLRANGEIIQTALKTYHSDHGQYPPSLEVLAPEYLSSIPLIPVTKKEYYYILQENGKKYKLCLDKSQTTCFSARKE